MTDTPSDAAMKAWREAFRQLVLNGANVTKCPAKAEDAAEAVIERAIAEAVAEREARIVARYTWAANALLACDYGDNPRGVVGWRVYGWRTPNGSRRIYGASIDEAIDSAIERGDHKERADG